MKLKPKFASFGGRGDPWIEGSVVNRSAEGRIPHTAASFEFGGEQVLVSGVLAVLVPVEFEPFEVSGPQHPKIR